MWKIVIRRYNHKAIWQTKLYQKEVNYFKWWRKYTRIYGLSVTMSGYRLEDGHWQLDNRWHYNPENDYAAK